MKGHLDALARMIKEGRNCTCLLDQSMAIQNSLKSLDILIIEKYLKSGIANQFRKQNERVIIKEFLEIFKRKQNRVSA